MLIPVVVTEFGEELVGYPGKRHELGTDETEESPMSISVHGRCRGFVDRKDVSNSHDVLKCRACFLRVYVPKSVQTYGDIRRHFIAYNSPQT